MEPICIDGAGRRVPYKSYLAMLADKFPLFRCINCCGLRTAVGTPWCGWCNPGDKWIDPYYHACRYGEQTTAATRGKEEK